MQETPNLTLPYLEAAQAQKHVTVNEAIRRLDAVTQLAVISRTVAAPPTAPADGDRYIVPEGATGAWSGQAGKIAAHQDGAWVIITPRAGWLAFVTADQQTFVWSGTAWAALMGVSQTLGWPTPADTGSENGWASALNTVLLTAPVTADGFIEEMVIASSGAQPAFIVVANQNSSTSYTVVSETAVSLVDGLNTLKLAIPVAANQRVGVRFVMTSGGMRFQNSSNPLGIEVWFVAGGAPIGVATTGTLSGAHRSEIRFTVRTGLTGDVARTRADRPAGSPVDATAALRTARGQHPHPYLQQAAAVTALDASGGGFWGPAPLLLNGRRFFLPTNPAAGNLLLGLRAALAEEIGAGAPLLAIGDSITHWAYASTGARHWLNLLAGFANIQSSPGDEPVMTALRPFQVYTPAFYGVTTAGTITTGTRGPIGESAILAAGASLSFTGAYAQIDVFYQQEAGAGSLAFQFNGGAAFKTVNAAGATELDRFSGPTTTGQAASGTYTITASGGPVEITGLVRLAALPSATTPRLPVIRAARGSRTIADFNTDRVTAALKQCAAFSATPPFVLVMLGANDRFTRTADQNRTDLEALIDRLTGGGVRASRIAIIPHIRPSVTYETANLSGRPNADAVNGGLAAAARANGARFLHQIASADFANEFLLSDGLHMNDAGNERLAQLVIETLAALP